MLKPKGSFVIRETVIKEDGKGCSFSWLCAGRLHGSPGSLRLPKDIFVALTLAGFVNAVLKMAGMFTESASRRAANEEQDTTRPHIPRNLTLSDEATHTVEIASSKAAWELGASTPLKRPATSAQTQAGAATKVQRVSCPLNRPCHQRQAKVWSIDAGDDDDYSEPAKAKPTTTTAAWKISADEELVDEDSLLTDADMTAIAKRQSGTKLAETFH